MRLDRIAPLLAAIALGCGGASPEPAPRPRRDESTADRAPRELVTAASARDLAADATFADLVAAARRQDDLRDQDSSAGCLLRARPPRLEADLAAAVRPLPEPPPSLGARLEGAVAVLTRYGPIGDPSAALGLVAFTTSRPAAGAGAYVLVVTERALYLGHTARARFDEIDRSRLARLDDGASHVVVTAAAGLPLAALVPLLAELPSLPGRVALAVALPEGTRMPAPAPSAAETAPVCELSPMPDEAWGDLSVDALRQGTAPLADRARLCAGTTDGPGALGGRVVISMRIDPAGRVTEACVTEDETDDGTLRACLVAAARELAFAAPSGGSVDVALPIRIEPGPTHRQIALCE